MAFAPHTNDRIYNGAGEKIAPCLLGSFNEKDGGCFFEYAERLPGLFPDNFGTDCPHVVYVGPNAEMRLAIVKKTVAYVVTGERPDGSASYERWFIKNHRVYAR